MVKFLMVKQLFTFLGGALRDLHSNVELMFMMPACCEENETSVLTNFLKSS